MTTTTSTTDTTRQTYIDSLLDIAGALTQNPALIPPFAVDEAGGCNVYAHAEPEARVWVEALSDRAVTRELAPFSVHVHGRLGAARVTVKIDDRAKPTSAPTLVAEPVLAAWLLEAVSA